MVDDTDDMDMMLTSSMAVNMSENSETTFNKYPETLESFNTSMAESTNYTKDDADTNITQYVRLLDLNHINLYTYTCMYTCT